MPQLHENRSWLILTMFVIPLFVLAVGTIVQVTGPEIRQHAGLPSVPATATVDVVAPAPSKTPDISSIVEPPNKTSFAGRWHGPQGTAYEFIGDRTALTLYVLPGEGSRINVGKAHVEQDTLVVEKFLSPVYAKWGDLPRLNISGDRLVGRGPSGDLQTYFIAGD